MNSEIKNKVQEAIDSQKEFSGKVTKLGFENNVPFMLVSIDEFGLHGVIRADEADAEVERKSLLPLLDAELPFLIIGIEGEDKIICSRKRCQENIKLKLMPELLDGKVMQGVVVHTGNYGVYVQAGGISGLLKNADYINNATPVSEFLGLGSKVDVICKDVSPSGQIQWKPAVRPKITDVDYDVQVNTCVPGKVINLKPFASGGVGVFVRIDRGLDALCLLPADMELQPGDKVAVKINSIEPAKDEYQPPRVKGSILKTL